MTKHVFQHIQKIQKAKIELPKFRGSSEFPVERSNFRSNVRISGRTFKIQKNGSSENFGGTRISGRTFEFPVERSKFKKTGHPKISATPPKSYKNHIKSYKNHIKSYKKHIKSTAALNPPSRSARGQDGSCLHKIPDIQATFGVMLRPHLQ